MLFFAIVMDNEGDQLKVEAIFNRYHGTMIKTALDILHDNHSAEDAVSESIIKIIRNLHKIGDIRTHQTRAFVVIIVKRTCIDILRKQNKSHEVLSFDGSIESDLTVPSALDELCARECCDRLTETILSLSPLESEILFLYTQYEYTIPELAEFLGISRDAVKMRLSRARKKLALSLEKEGQLSEQAEKR